MSLRARFTEEMKKAMIARDQARLSTIRLITAALKDRDIAARPEGLVDGIAEEQILSMLSGMIKQRRESIDLYQKGNRPDLVEKEQAEISVIETFLPKQMSEDEVKAAVDGLLTELSVASIKDLGKLMAEAKKRWPGAMDFSKASAYARGKLAS